MKSPSKEPRENRVSEGSREGHVGVQGGLPAEELKSEQTRNGPGAGGGSSWAGKKDTCVYMDSLQLLSCCGILFNLR